MMQPLRVDDLLLLSGYGLSLQAVMHLLWLRTLHALAHGTALPLPKQLLANSSRSSCTCTAVLWSPVLAVMSNSKERISPVRMLSSSASTPERASSPTLTLLSWARTVRRTLVSSMSNKLWSGFTRTLLPSAVTLITVRSSLNFELTSTDLFCSCVWWTLFRRRSGRSLPLE